MNQTQARAKLEQATKLIFEVENELNTNSNIRREGYRARIGVGEFLLNFRCFGERDKDLSKDLTVYP